ncbi:hypothetical protein DYB37_003773 [Aphanomyces astaci]|uniref:Uncharacterized protein n=1 Tax=Aphanomyces astaci TaxID=112090 RepID=A0A3L6UZ46_APHAT|nr:hypothetical protein DYB35_003050 [Aphanomyces astaci]RHZ33055.1 hypothetical protein DYB37_003773 [Aphanomyces astaci]RLO01871.1 hypothetical protein DYB28_000177 [Aphanomyces astaci]
MRVDVGKKKAAVIKERLAGTSPPSTVLLSLSGTLTSDLLLNYHLVQQGDLVEFAFCHADGDSADLTWLHRRQFPVVQVVPPSGLVVNFGVSPLFVFDLTQHTRLKLKKIRGTRTIQHIDNASLGFGCPVSQLVYWDLLDLLPKDIKKERQFQHDAAGSVGEAHVLALFGRAAVERLRDARVVVIGCGSVGCQVVQHVHFNHSFWQPMDVVVSTVDSDHTTLHLDDECFTYEKPWVLGHSHGHHTFTQTFVPHITERWVETKLLNTSSPSSSSSLFLLDRVTALRASISPPLKSLPHGVDHTDSSAFEIHHMVQWARTVFDDAFHQSLVCLRATWTDRIGSSRGKRRDPAFIRMASEAYNRCQALTSVAACVDMARWFLEMDDTNMHVYFVQLLANAVAARQDIAPISFFQCKAICGCRADALASAAIVGALATIEATKILFRKPKALRTCDYLGFNGALQFHIPHPPAVMHSTSMDRSRGMPLRICPDNMTLWCALAFVSKSYSLPYLGINLWCNARTSRGC